MTVGEDWDILVTFIYFALKFLASLKTSDSRLTTYKVAPEGAVLGIVMRRKLKLSIQLILYM